MADAFNLYDFWYLFLQVFVFTMLCEKRLGMVMQCPVAVFVYTYGIVSLIASEQFAKNPPPRRIGKPRIEAQNMEIWISGYLDIWIFGYLDSGKNGLLMHLQSGLLCGAALPGAFFYRTSTSLVFLQPKPVFLAFY